MTKDKHYAKKLPKEILKPVSESSSHFYATRYSHIRTTTGRVRWFNKSLGYGFIVEKNSRQDLFFHQKDIQIPEYRQLKPNQRVIFELVKLEDTKDVCRNIIPIME